jgi:hypothetical protein
MHLRSGSIDVVRAPPGLQAELDIGSPPVRPDCTIVAIFHTHPNPSAEGWYPGPSETNEQLLAALGVPGLIRADDGIHTAGPRSRPGAWAGGPGFPP